MKAKKKCYKNYVILSHISTYDDDSNKLIRTHIHAKDECLLIFLTFNIVEVTAERKNKNDWIKIVRIELKLL